MIRKETKDILIFLNEIYNIDPVWMQSIVDFRPICNEKLVNHPSVQVTAKSTAGLIGLINGYCGTYDDGLETGYGPIAAKFDDESGKLLGFQWFNNRIPNLV